MRKLTKIESENLVDLVEQLEKLFDERIVDLHQVKGWAQARHCYIYYRSLVWQIQKIMDKRGGEG